MSMQTANEAINNAADEIAYFDPRLANAYRTQPFRRQLLIKAFNNGFRTHSELSAKVVQLAECAAKLWSIEVAIAARDSQ